MDHLDDIAVMEPPRPALRLPTAAARTYVAALRRRHPGASPAQLLYVMERQYLLVMSAGGSSTGLLSLRRTGIASLLGLSAAHLGASGAVSVVYLLAMAEIYGLPPSASQVLVTRCTFGKNPGGILDQQLGLGPKWWNTALAYLPASQVRFTAGVAERSLERAARRGGVVAASRALPAGIGTAVGAVAGRALANRIIDAATELLGSPPRHFDLPPPDHAATVPADV